VPRRTQDAAACASRWYAIDAHPILSADWLDEREVELGAAVAGAKLDSAARPQWLVFDLTDLVADGVMGLLPNSGVLLKLADADETYGVGGPKLPSSSFENEDLRPRLEVTYLSVPT
jgi:hypothetical protein